MLERAVDFRVLAQLDTLLRAMHTRTKVSVMSHTGTSVTSIVNSITAEDGSGNRFIIGFSNGESVYLDLSMGVRVSS
jgi:hypothetical protein